MSSADQTGWCELKRLKKEIAFLRHALEETQTKSEELEEKMHGAVAGEAFKIMRSKPHHHLKWQFINLCAHCQTS